MIMVFKEWFKIKNFNKIVYQRLPFYGELLGENP